MSRKITRRHALGLLGLAIAQNAFSGCATSKYTQARRETPSYGVPTPKYRVQDEQTLLLPYQSTKANPNPLTPEQKQGLIKTLEKSRKFKRSNKADSNYYDLRTGEYSELFRTPEETESALAIGLAIDCDDLAIWRADRFDKLKISNRVVIGRLAPKFHPSYHAWNEIFASGYTYVVDDVFVREIADNLVIRTLQLHPGIMRTEIIPKKYYQGLFTFTGPYTEQRLEQLQKDWNKRKKELNNGNHKKYQAGQRSNKQQQPYFYR